MSTYTDEPKQIQADLKGDGFTTVATNGSDIGPGSLESQQPDIEAEKRVLKKVDRHIIPLVMLLYLLSFMDRVNIGNARLYGLEEDLGLSKNQFQIAISILFVTYVSFEIPSNLVLKKFKPSRWLAFLAVSSGLIATFMGFCNSYGALLACRLLLGASEAGLFPGLTVYLTLFYTKHEIALRMAYLFVSAAVAGGCGGLLAYGIGFMDGVAGYRGWRWILIIEGLPSILVGIACWCLLANDMESASYLTHDEKAILIAKRNRQPGFSVSGLEQHKADIIAAFKDWKVWAMCVAHFGADTMLYGYSAFLPTSIKALGTWNTAEVQALTIPCYAVGSIAYLTMAYLSDRQQRRALYVVISCAISALGYAILISPVSSGVRYFGCLLVALGLYAVVGIPMSWLPMNYPRYGTRITASGLQITIGNLGGVVSPFLYPTGDGPRYIKGYAVTMSLVILSGCIFASMGFVFRRINKNRDAAAYPREQIPAHKRAELGDRSPSFRYTY